MSSKPPFAASPPPVKDNKVQHDSVIRPTAEVLALAELEGSPFVVSGDSKGVVSVWDVGSGNRESEEPDHYFEAHGPPLGPSPISTVLMLRSSRVGHLVEECEWPDVAAQRHLGMSLVEQRDMMKAGLRGPPRLAPEEAPGKLVGDPKELADGEDREGIVSEDIAPPPRRRSCLCALLSKLCCCKCCCGGGKSLSSRPTERHWILATAAEDGVLNIWRWRPTPKNRRKLPDALPYEVDFLTGWQANGNIPIRSCVELHDGTIAVALKGSPDPLVVDPGASVVKFVLFGHTGPVSALAQCHDGRLATGSEDGAVRLWAKRNWERGAFEDKQDKVASGKGLGDLVDEDARKKAWEDPAQEMAGAGVSSMAFFAHTQQRQKGETIKTHARILVQRAENLPKADYFSKSDPYVTVTVVDGDPGIVEARTPNRMSGRGHVTFQHRATLTLRRCLINGRWQLPESAVIDFEVHAVGRTYFSKDTLLGHWSANVDEVLAQIARDADDTRTPKPHQLHAPVGEGPFQDLKDSAILVGFEQVNENTLDCLIDSAEGLAVGTGRSICVHMTLRSHSASGGKVRCVASKIPQKTSVIDNELNPVWNEVLEVEIPSKHLDSQVMYGPDLFLHFEVYDSDTFTADDLLATLTLPFARALQGDNQQARPYELMLASGYKVGKTKPPKRNSKVAAGDEASSQLREAAQAPPPAGADALPRLYLAFQLLIPCPIQLKCNVECARGLPPIAHESAPMVRIRMVEGDPLLPQTSAVRTQKVLRSLTPVWNERCVLTLPKVHFEKKKEIRPGSVRRGWEHEGQPPQMIVSAEVFDAEMFHSDNSMGRAMIPLAEAISLALAPGHAARAFELSTPAEQSAGQVYLGFDTGPGPTDLTVYVEKADRLHASGDVSADPYCVVRVAEVGAFGQPTDKFQHRSMGHDTPTVDLGAEKENPVWNHDVLMDLPGAEVNGKIATRPNWFVHFEVIDSDEYLRTEVPLLQAMLPLSNLLSELHALEEPKPDPALMKSRTDTLKWGQYTDRQETHRERDYLAKELDLTSIGKGGLTKGVSEKNLGHSKDSDPSDSLTPLSKEASMSSQQSKSGRGMLGKAAKLFGRSGGPDSESVDASHAWRDERQTLTIHFQLVSRWQGLGRDRRKPLAKTMTKPSPVTCITALASHLVAGYENGNIFVWDATGQSAVPLHQFEAHRVPISGLVYLPLIDSLVSTALPRTRVEAVSSAVTCVWSAADFHLRQALSMNNATTRCVVAMSAGADKKKKAGKDCFAGPCLVLGTETRQSKLIQLVKYSEAQVRPDNPNGVDPP